jgi:ribosomal protein S18 acetylase RimI-like enzyme
MNIRLLEADEVDKVIPFLLLAEPSEFALRWSLENMSDAVYGMEEGGELVGAATVRWQSEPSEILELGIATDHQRKGLGKQFLMWLVDEAKRREKAALLVGTSNTSVGNILFYQKCGFRMDHVRVDYLRYYRKPRFENGIQVRDLLVFKMDLAEQAK